MVDDRKRPQIIEFESRNGATWEATPATSAIGVDVPLQLRSTSTRPRALPQRVDIGSPLTPPALPFYRYHRDKARPWPTSDFASSVCPRATPVEPANGCHKALQLLPPTTKVLVGVEGVEPPTSCASCMRSNQLSYTPERSTTLPASPGRRPPTRSARLPGHRLAERAARDFRLWRERRIGW